MPIKSTASASIALVALLLAGCSSSSTLQQNAGASANQPDFAALEAIYNERIQEETSRFNEADVTFFTGMIGHHAQALIMSAYAPENGANPELQRLAARIINAQKDEIATMQKWLADRDQPVPVVAEDGTTSMPMAEGMDHNMHGDHGGMDHSMMPGMLTDAQLAELAAARGVEFDRLFLRYMIQHHAGAIVMVDELFAAQGAAQGDLTFKMASEINVDQRTEIARMQRMLDALPPGTTAPSTGASDHQGHN